jgi:hypothetical protein
MKGPPKACRAAQEAAVAAGELEYISPVACPRGHFTRYTVNSYCCECNRDRGRARNLAGRRYSTSTAGVRSPVKSTFEEVRLRRKALVEIVNEVSPATVRQIFYQATVRGVVPKTEAGYVKVALDLKYLREECDIDYDDIVDNTRWISQPQTFGSAEEAIGHAAKYYRQALWRDSADYIQIWLEKDALSGVVYPITAEWDVPLCIARGYVSLSLAHTAAMELEENEYRNCYVYHLGDYDPSGQDAARDIERKLREMAPDCDFEFERLAVTPDQIAEWNLPTRPTKKSDPRAKGFSGQSVELDAIPPDELRRIVRDIIERHVDHEELAVLKVAEKSERELLNGLAGVGRAA